MNVVRRFWAWFTTSTRTLSPFLVCMSGASVFSMVLQRDVGFVLTAIGVFAASMLVSFGLYLAEREARADERDRWSQTLHRQPSNRKIGDAE